VRHERRIEQDEHPQRDGVAVQKRGGLGEVLDGHALVERRQRIPVNRFEPDRYLQPAPDQVAKAPARIAVRTAQERRMRFDDHAVEPGHHRGDFLVVVRRDG
jgi:hypothetical protein